MSGPTVTLPFAFGAKVVFKDGGPSIWTVVGFNLSGLGTQVSLQHDTKYRSTYPENLKLYVEQVKPCPFCAGSDIGCACPPHAYRYWCLGCSGSGPVCLSKEDALKEWNRRK